MLGCVTKNETYPMVGTFWGGWYVVVYMVFHHVISLRNVPTFRNELSFVLHPRMSHRKWKKQAELATLAYAALLGPLINFLCDILRPHPVPLSCLAPYYPFQQVPCQADQRLCNCQNIDPFLWLSHESLSLPCSERHLHPKFLSECQTWN